MRRETIRCLKETAAKCRLNVVRMLRASGHGHIGGTYSSIDMVTALYFYKMNVNPEKPDWEDRDRFLLSAGHKSMVQYAVLAEKGYFPKEILDTYGHLHSKLAGHPNMHKLPGVEASTGALGHGLSIATGMAMGLQLDKKPSKVYTILGDGELAEGSNWEAAAAAAHYKLDNLTWIVDRNHLQISGNTEDVMPIENLKEKAEAFGFKTIEINGHDYDEISDALDTREEGKPVCVIANTIKGKGLACAENQAGWHHKTPSLEQVEQLKEDMAEYRKELA